MFFHKMPWIFGVAQSLESFRQSQIGGLTLGMFIEEASDSYAMIEAQLPTLSSLNDLLYATIVKVAVTTPWLFSAYLDMHTGIE